MPRKNNQNTSQAKTVDGTQKDVQSIGVDMDFKPYLLMLRKKKWQFTLDTENIRR